MLRHHAVWRLAIYSFLSVDYGNYRVKDHLAFQLKAYKLNGLDKEVVFSRKYYESFLIAIQSFNLHGWSLLTGGLCSEVVYTKVKTNQKYPTLLPFHSIPPFQSTISVHHSIPLNPDAPLSSTTRLQWDKRKGYLQDDKHEKLFKFKQGSLFVCITKNGDNKNLMQKYCFNGTVNVIALYIT